MLGCVQLILCSCGRAAGLETSDRQSTGFALSPGSFLVLLSSPSGSFEGSYVNRYWKSRTGKWMWQPKTWGPGAEKRFSQWCGWKEGMHGWRERSGSGTEEGNARRLEVTEFHSGS